MTVVYTSETCSYCPMLKKYLKHFGVNFIEKSINDPEVAAEAQRISGSSIVPIVHVDDMNRQAVVVGLNYRRLSEIFNP